MKDSELRNRRLRMADCNRNSKSNVAIGIRMDTKIEARASEQGADEALKTLYGRVGIGAMVFLSLMGLAAFVWALSALI